MIKRILVALDPDGDTPVATRYAIRLAKKFDAELTGLAVVDVGNLNTMIGVGGYGTEYAAREVWVEMTEETQKVAQNLLNVFKKSVEKEGIRHRDLKQQGASAELIIEEMKYHDLLVLGRDSKFFYSEPDKDTRTLAKVVKGGVSPTLVVTDEYREIENIMIAFDGSSAAARSLKAFVHLLPYGKDIEIDLVNVADGESSEAMEKSASILKMAENYLKAHNFNYIIKTVLEKGEPGLRILDRQLMKNPDLLLLGAHSVSAVKRTAFGSTTHYLITSTMGPLFLSP
ncbi:universal stress protein [Rhodohalobacter barkolensis]|uniref:Universal stress protein n=1 Tax=Rhodohalobacter barkolensis TaxID=2053187 RepID=A0A2N0VIR9_9BACT|nr:universal stress protein [Rhodohalobacter barkolensis]PKD44064.1 universal stress protein [Rhodohalobacter barkolensis]